MAKSSTVLSVLLIAITFQFTSAVVYPEKTNITNKDPDFPFTGEMYTGYIVIDEASGANLFYNLYAIDQGKTTQDGPLTIWL